MDISRTWRLSSSLLMPLLTAEFGREELAASSGEGSTLGLCPNRAAGEKSRCARRRYRQEKRGAFTRPKTRPLVFFPLWCLISGERRFERSNT